MRSKIKIVFFGDSLTQRSMLSFSPNPVLKYSLDYSGSYVDILMRKLIVHFPEIEFEYYNKGIGGNTAADLINRFYDDVLSITPDILVLFIGQNDAKTYSALDFEINLKKLLSKLKQKEMKIMNLSTTPCPGESSKNKLLDEYDLVIKTLSQKFKTTFVDLKHDFNKILSANNELECPINIFNSGCHMSELGNILIADIVFDAVISNDILKDKS